MDGARRTAYSLIVRLPASENYAWRIESGGLSSGSESRG